MQKKSELLKELGWNNDLIQHFMIDDSVLVEEKIKELNPEVFETNKMMLTYNTGITEFRTGFSKTF